MRQPGIRKRDPRRILLANGRRGKSRAEASEETDSACHSLIAVNMTNKGLLLVAILFMGTAAFAQTRWTGRWSTNPLPKGWSGWTDSGVLNVLSEPPNFLEPPVRPPLNPNQFPTDVQLEVKVEGEKVSGFLGVDGIWEIPMKIELGKIEGNTIRFMTTRTRAGREPIYWVWSAELNDDNTMIMRRGVIGEGRGQQPGAPLSSGQQPTPAPTALPPLNRSVANASLTLHRLK